MGTDIHLAVERRQTTHGTAAWRRVYPPPELVLSDEYANARLQQNGIIWPPLHYNAATHPIGERVHVAWDSRFAYELRKAVADWYSHCNYLLFSVLAGVRSEDGDPPPIAADRGLPDDLSPELARWLPEHGDPDAEDDEYGNNPEWFDFGDHSFTWCTLREVLDYDWNAVFDQRGIVPWAAYVSWRRAGANRPPDTYSGAVYGRGIETLSMEAAERLFAEEERQAAQRDTDIRAARDLRRVYVDLTWSTSVSGCANYFVSLVVPALQKLAPNPDDIRLVMGFDS